jgi:4-hydroxybenzoate polyprenyltransferase
LPRWNALPLITGSLFLLVPIAGLITGSDELSVPVLSTIFLLIAAGFVTLGFVVQGDSVEEMTAA